jgi:hypothetical protein
MLPPGPCRKHGLTGKRLQRNTLKGCAAKSKTILGECIKPRGLMYSGSPTQPACMSDHVKSNLYWGHA